VSAVVSDIEREVAALHTFKDKPLPITCTDAGHSESLTAFIRECHFITRMFNPTRAYMKTPYEIVKDYYTFPFEFYPFQVHTTNNLARLPRAGHYLDMGLGKTAISMACALYQTLKMRCDRILIIVPPVLLTGWSRFISSIEDKETGPVSSLIYRGTPEERKYMKLDADITVVGIQIFKKHYEDFLKAYEGQRTVVIVDEAHALKNAGRTKPKKTDPSANHWKVRNFVGEDNHLMLLTGTPINSPIDAYAMVKLIAPSIYRSLEQFERIHVIKRDYFDRVDPKTGWGNLDLLQENLAVNSVRLLKRDVIHDLPPVTYEELCYDLDPKHLKLYRQLAEEHLLPLQDKEKLDATSVQALLHAMGQLVCNWGHFAQDESKVSQGFQLVDEVLDELGDGKLVVFSNYKMTNRHLLKYLKKYNPVAVYGEVNGADRDRAIDKFISDPTCRVFIGNPQSAGYGIDGLQKVCSTVMYLEPPRTPTEYNQSRDRLDRIGQVFPVTVKICTAVGTLHERQLEALKNNEDLVQTLTGGYMSLRRALGLK